MLYRLAFFILLGTFISVGVHAQMLEQPSVKLRALDKSTARSTTLEAKVGETIEYGSLFIKVQACRNSDPLDKPESAAFLQIWEVPLNATKSEWVFSGWMFASSPALSAMDHAVYDVWVLECTGGKAAIIPENSVTIDGVLQQDVLEETVPEVDNAEVQETPQPIESAPINPIDSIIDNAISGTDADSTTNEEIYD